MSKIGLLLLFVCPSPGNVCAGSSPEEEKKNDVQEAKGMNEKALQIFRSGNDKFYSGKQPAIPARLTLQEWLVCSRYLL